MSIILYTLCGSDPARPFSPHCWKIVMALHHKGLTFEERPVGFTRIPTLESGFSKTVPILRDGEELISDSFQIATYLERRYPDRPSLFGGEAGQAVARLVEGYVQTVVQATAMRIAAYDIYSMLAPDDQSYFRTSREQRLGKTLEEVRAGRDDAIASFPAQLQAMRHVLRFQPFIGGDQPLFADYILFGALQWLRITTGSIHLPDGDPVQDWFDRCLELHQGVGRGVA